MTEMVVKLLVELLSTLALATKQIKEGRSSEFIFVEALYYLTRCDAEKLVKKLFGGERDVETVLQRLDRLTLDEARITTAQTFEVVCGLLHNMRVVMDGEQGHHQAFHTLGVEDRSLDGKASADHIIETLSMFLC